MDRINGADTIDIGGGRRGFRDENLQNGIAGTEVTALWLNVLQEEIIKIIEAAGLEPSDSDWSQLYQALQVLGFSSSRYRRWMAVISMTLSSAPVAPEQGDAYLIPAGANGIWSAHIGKIAEWIGTAWEYTTQSDGHGIGLPDGRVFMRIGGTYGEKIAADVQAGKWTYVADTSGTPNLISVSPTPALAALTAGTGLRIKVAQTNTGKTTFNVPGFGDKDLVRTDGTILFDSDVVAGGIYDVAYDGTRWRLLNTIAAPQMRRAITLYVNATIGSDANDGTAPVAGKALASIQAAVNRAFTSGPSPYTLTINVADGVYGPVMTPERPGPSLKIIGNEANPSAVQINGGTSDAVAVQGPNVLTISGVKVSTGGVDRAGFIAYAQSTLSTKKTETGACSGSAYQAFGGGSIQVGEARYSGSCAALWTANVGGRLSLTEQQTFVSAISVLRTAWADTAGFVGMSNSVPPTFVNPGNVSGQRYTGTLNAIIYTIGGGANYFPGTTAGAVSAGAQYV